jgi:hypothetical protein
VQIPYTITTIAGGCCDEITLRATNPDFFATSFYALKVAGTYQATSTIFNNRQVVTDIGYSSFISIFTRYFFIKE